MTYGEIQVFTGRDIAAAQQPQTLEMQTAPQAEGLLAAEQARAVAEVQAALVIAASRPRNELRARDKLMQACQRIGLASSAVYQYSRGGSAVSGPSIRLAETAARAWGNMTYGFRELSRRGGESECEAFAWDLETNTKAVRQFTVRHRRDTKKGGYDLKDERDIYELLANQAQRRVRATILEIIPGDIVEDAVAECEKTMTAKIGNVSEAAKKLVEAFEAIGVSREQVELRLGHRIDAIQPAQVLSFRRIYTSIKDGMSTAQDWFPPVAAKAEAPKAETPKVEEKPAAQAQTLVQEQAIIIAEGGEDMEKKSNAKKTAEKTIKNELRAALKEACGEDEEKQRSLFNKACAGKDDGKHSLEEIDGLTLSAAEYILQRVKQISAETAA